MSNEFKQALIGAKVTAVETEDYGTTVRITFDNKFTLKYFHSEHDAALYLTDEQGREVVP